MRQGSDFDLTFECESGPVRVFHVADGLGNTLRVLDCGGTYESATYLGERYCDLFFEYTKRFDLMFCAKREIRRTLMIGGGGYSYPKHVLATHDEVSMDVIEIDEAITDIARDLFGLDDCIEEFDLEESGRLRLFTADGYEWLRAHDDTYDAIVNDAFVQGDAVASLADSHAAHLIHAHVNEGGVYLVNVVSALEGSSSNPLWKQVEALRTAFANVWVVPLGQDEPYDPDNVIVVASDDALEIEGAYKSHVS